jgi:hypothetical protein
MTADQDFTPELCGKPGDPVHGASRENFSGQSLNAYLDTAGGQALAAQYGGRAQAAEALAAGDRADRAWRREMALPRAAAYPDRFPTVEDAVNAIPDPVGGRGAQLAGDEQDIADAARRADPAHPWHVIRGLPDATVAGVSMGPDGRVHTADTRAPWQRGD